MASNNTTYVLLILVIIIILIYNCWSNVENFMNRKKTCNTIDERCYDISTQYNKNTHKKASELLAYLNKFAVRLMRHLRTKYLFNKNGSVYRQKMIEYLLHNYNPDTIIENVPISSENTSYVEDKGKVFALCLREKKSGKHNFHDKHILEFVLMHEIAHLTAFNMGHGPEFWLNFKIILQEAKEIGIHKPVNYKKTPKTYCSLLIDYNPFYDKNIPDKLI